VTSNRTISNLIQRTSSRFSILSRRLHLLGRSFIETPEERDFDPILNQFLAHSISLGDPQNRCTLHQTPKERSVCKRIGVALVVVDTLSQFAGLTGDRENNSGDALEAMGPLQAAAAEGIGVLVVRHERKSGGEVGDSGRGSSAFAGAVDIVLSLRKPEGKAPKTRRLLQSVSRFSETLNDLLVDLTEGGYVALGERHETAIKDAKDLIFAAAPKLEAEAIDLRELAKTISLPRVTAQRAVDELVRDGLLNRMGEGKKGNPFRYFLTEKRF